MVEAIKIHETKYWKVFLNENQAYLGYSVVVLKRDAEKMSAIANEE